MKFSHHKAKGFTLVELLATIAIMAVLIVAALPYVADYTSWARETSQRRDAQVVAGAIARWIAVGGDTTGAGSPASEHDWRGATLDEAWADEDGNAAGIILDLVDGWTVVPDGSKDPFLAPNTSWAVLGRNVKILFDDSRNYTVTARTTN